MNRSILITGCTPGGIGHALAREFKSKGARVFATARSAETINDLAEIGIETLSLEVTDRASIIALRDEIASRTGGSLDFLVNNAGRNYTVPALHFDIDELRDTFESNVLGVMMMCQQFAPLLIKAKGTIVQIGSIAALMPYVFSAAYNASKAALHSYSDALRVELAPFDVKVVIAVTGGVKSNIARRNEVLPADSLYQPIAEDYKLRITHSQNNTITSEEYSSVVVQSLLHKPKKDTLWAGANCTLVWFISSFFPRWVMDRIMTNMFNLEKLRPKTHGRVKP